MYDLKEVGGGLAETGQLIVLSDPFPRDTVCRRRTVSQVGASRSYAMYIII